VSSRPRPLVLLVVAAALAGGCSDRRSAPDVAAVVEGTKIAAAQTEALLETHVRNELAKAGSGRIDGDRKQTLTHFVLLYQIKHALLRHLAKGMHVSVETTNGSSPEAEAGRLSQAMAERLFPDVAEEQRQGRFLEWFDEQLRAAEVRVDGHFGRWDSGRGVVQ
jgi:type IV pilus biogenesis protein CpaD/CtpE